MIDREEPLHSVYIVRPDLLRSGARCGQCAHIVKPYRADTDSTTQDMLHVYIELTAS